MSCCPSISRLKPFQPSSPTDCAPPSGIWDQPTPTADARSIHRGESSAFTAELTDGRPVAGSYLRLPPDWVTRPRPPCQELSESLCSRRVATATRLLLNPSNLSDGGWRSGDPNIGEAADLPDLSTFGTFHHPPAAQPGMKDDSCFLVFLLFGFPTVGTMKKSHITRTDGGELRVDYLNRNAQNVCFGLRCWCSVFVYSPHTCVLTSNCLCVGSGLPGGGVCLSWLPGGRSLSLLAPWGAELRKMMELKPAC